MSIFKTNPRVNRRLASRVAVRCLKTSTIQAPPVMLEHAVNWFHGRIAKLAFREARKVLQTLDPPNPEDQYDQKEITREYLERGVLYDLKRTVDTVKEVFPDQDPYRAGSKTLPTDKGDLEVSLISDAEGRVSFDGGRSVVVPRSKLVDTILSVVQKHDLSLIEENPEYRKHLEVFQKENPEMSPQEAREKKQELQKVMDLWKPHLGRDRGLPDSIPLDLDGWYFPLDDFKNAEEADIPLGLKTVWIPRSQYNGTFDPRLLEIRIKVPSDILNFASSERVLEELIPLLRHEMQHYAQYLIDLKTGKDALDLSGEAFDELNTVPHNLQSFEFDTILQDEIVDYRKWIRHVPDRYVPLAFRIWVSAIKPSDRSRLPEFFEWMKQDRKHYLLSRFARRIVELEKGRSFFYDLKREDPQRWRKAVKVMASKVRTR